MRKTGVEKLNWHTNTISTEELETLKRRTKIESQAGMETRIRGVLIQYQGMLEEHVYDNTEIYREVTSGPVHVWNYGAGFLGISCYSSRIFRVQRKRRGRLYFG